MRGRTTDRQTDKEGGKRKMWRAQREKESFTHKKKSAQYFEVTGPPPPPTTTTTIVFAAA